MPTYMVEHRLEEKQFKEDESLISEIIEMAAHKKLPPGYQLLGVVLNQEKRQAGCFWEAQSKNRLGSLVMSLKPPTTYFVNGVEVLYGLEKVSLGSI